MEIPREASKQMKAISLVYHDVTERGGADASGFPGGDAALYKLERAQFESHLRAIAAAVTESPARVSDVLTHGLKQTPLLLTFDDGGVSAYTVTADMLERAGWRGHFFITTDFIETQGFLSRAQIRELHERGHVIGSHSCSHPVRMSHCSTQEALDEWRVSVEKLSDIIGEAVTTGSVPGGFYSRMIAETASCAGLRVLFNSEPVTVGREVDGCLVLGRYSIQRGTTPEVAARLAAGRLAPRLKQAFGWNAKKVFKKLGGRYWLKARKALLSGR
jgi:peptidoglycan/xylan/chitin deacetylase (PgdA/CDA1 family)